MEPNDYEPVPPRQRKKPKVKESIIDHTYRDYSQVEVSSDDEAPSTVDIDKKSSRLQPNFPAKLHAIVSNPNYQHIICWQPHGRSWKIVDKHLLSTVICPKHFAHAKFESFNRSVNGWGFKVSAHNKKLEICAYEMARATSYHHFCCIYYCKNHCLSASVESRTGK